MYRAECLMLDAMSLSTLDRYRDLIKSYATRCGPKVWVIVYQADFCARLEHIECMKRTGRKLQAEGSVTDGRQFDNSSKGKDIGRA